MSPILWRKVRPSLSAGRVQSVATKIICDREIEIEKFVPKEYWSIGAELKKKGEKISIKSMFYGDTKEKVELNDKETVDTIMEQIGEQDFTVKKIKKRPGAECW